MVHASTQQRTLYVDRTIARFFKRNISRKSENQLIYFIPIRPTWTEPNKRTLSTLLNTNYRNYDCKTRHMFLWCGCIAHVFAPKDWFTQAIVAHFPNIIIGIVETKWNFSYADDVNVNILASVQKMTVTFFCSFSWNESRYGHVLKNNIFPVHSEKCLRPQKIELWALWSTTYRMLAVSTTVALFSAIKSLSLYLKLVLFLNNTNPYTHNLLSNNGNPEQ